MHCVRARDAEAPDQRRRHPQPQPDFGEIRDGEVAADEHRERGRVGVAAREHVRVHVLRDELREHHSHRRQEQPAPEPRPAHVAHRRGDPGHARLVGLFVAERAPAPQRPPREREHCRRRAQQCAPHGDRRERTECAGGERAECAAHQTARARADREYRHQPLAGQRVEVVAREGPEVVREHALGQVVGRDQPEPRDRARRRDGDRDAEQDEPRSRQHLREQRVVAQRADHHRVDPRAEHRRDRRDQERER